MYNFPNVRSKFLHNNVSNNMYVRSMHWVFQRIFCILQAFMFFDRQKGGQTEKKKAHFREPMFRNWASRTSHRRPLGPKRSPFWVWDGAHRTRATRPPCSSLSKDQTSVRSMICAIPRHCFVDEVFGPAHSQCDLQGPTPRVRTVKHIQHSTTSQTVHQRSFLHEKQAPKGES